MKASELRDKTVEELNSELVNLNKERFSFRMQQSTGQLGQSHLLKEVTRNIARVQTVINEKKRQSAAEQA